MRAKTLTRQNERNFNPIGICVEWDLFKFVLLLHGTRMIKYNVNGFSPNRETKVSPCLDEEEAKVSGSELTENCNLQREDPACTFLNGTRVYFSEQIKIVIAYLPRNS